MNRLLLSGKGPTDSGRSSVLWAVISILFIANPLLGDVLLEFDFQNVTDNKTTASHYLERGSGLAELQNGAMIETGQSAVGKGIPPLQKGVLFIPKANSAGYLTTENEGEKGFFQRYATTNKSSFGSGVLIAIYKPEFSGSVKGDSAANRMTLFCTNVVGTDTRTFTWYICDRGIRLRMHAKENAIDVILPSPEWSPDKWYFLGCSWSEGKNPTLYVREIGTEASEFVEGNKIVATTQYPIRLPIRIGNTGGTSPASPMRGEMAYFLWKSDYIEVRSGYDSLYEEIVSPKE